MGAGATSVVTLVGIVGALVLIPVGPNHGWLALVERRRAVRERLSLGETIRRGQAEVALEIGAQLEDGGTSAQAIAGVMLESFLVGGAQNLDVAEHAAGRAELVYGQSVTDACMEWDVSVSVLDQLAASARKRRTAK